MPREVVVEGTTATSKTDLPITRLDSTGDVRRLGIGHRRRLAAALRRLLGAGGASARSRTLARALVESRRCAGLVAHSRADKVGVASSQAGCEVSGSNVTSLRP